MINMPSDDQIAKYMLIFQCIEKVERLADEADAIEAEIDEAGQLIEELALVRYALIEKRTALLEHGKEGLALIEEAIDAL